MSYQQVEIFAFRKTQEGGDCYDAVGYLYTLTLNLTEVNLKISGQWAPQNLDCCYGGIEAPMPRSAVRSLGLLSLTN